MLNVSRKDGPPRRYAPILPAGNLKKINSAFLKEAWHTAIEAEDRTTFERIRTEIQRRATAEPSMQRRAALSYADARALKINHPARLQPQKKG